LKERQKGQEDKEEDISIHKDGLKENRRYQNLEEETLDH
jgi:hypothetical protein